MIPAGLRYAAPTSLDEALSLLGTNAGARPLSGGTGLFAAARGSDTPLLVDLRKIGGLDAVSELAGGALSLGAGLRFREALAEPRLRTPARAVLAEAIAATKDPQIRNVATLGGALGAPTSDLATALIASDATTLLVRTGGRRELPVAELLGTGGPAAGELILSFTLPAPPPSATSAWERFTHPASGWGVVAAAVVVARDPSGAISTARVALAGATGRPVRLAAVEKALVGGPPTADRLTAAAKLAAEGLTFPGDHFASPDYRAHLARVLVRRALAKATA